MKIIWLGQAGFLIEIDNRIIIIDPYLSDSVEKVQPSNYRRVAVDESFLSIKPNIILLTHNHLDHYDEETLNHYIHNDSNITVLASQHVWENVRKYGGNNNYVLFNEGSEWTFDNFIVKAVYAEHSDDKAIGFIISYKKKNYYFTGDTLFSKKIINNVRNIKIDVVFLPINGVGNNMNMKDASRFAKMVKAKKVVPIHFGTFDEITEKDIHIKNSIIPKIYKEIPL